MVICGGIKYWPDENMWYVEDKKKKMYLVTW